MKKLINKIFNHCWHDYYQDMSSNTIFGGIWYECKKCGKRKYKR